MNYDPLTHLRLSCRRIFLRDHVVPVNIGAHDFEKTQAQRVIFNVELFVNYSQSTPQADQLAEVVNYDFVRDVIAQRNAAGTLQNLSNDSPSNTAARPARRTV